MYRILAEIGEIRERRDQLRHPEYEKPELLATGPNQLWSWDITKLRGPQKWTCYYLYLIMDVFSRYVVGWMIAENENATLASELIEVTCRRQGVDRAELTIHADRGSAMTSKTVAQLLVDLGVEKSHSRPHVSNDNPYSESQFKTMKYRPGYPKRFGSIMDARNWVREFIAWYNEVHRHSGIGLMHRKWFTTEKAKSCGRNALWFLKPPTRPIRRGLFAECRKRRCCPRPSGSTNRSKSIKTIVNRTRVR